MANLRIANQSPTKDAAGCVAFTQLTVDATDAVTLYKNAALTTPTEINSVSLAGVLESAECPACYASPFLGFLVGRQGRHLPVRMARLAPQAGQVTAPGVCSTLQSDPFSTTPTTSCVREGLLGTVRWTSLVLTVLLS